MKQLVHRAQIKCRRIAQSFMRKVGRILLPLSFALSFGNLQSAYHDYLLYPTLSNKLKYEFRQLGAAEKVKKQSKTYFMGVETLTT